MYKLGSLSEASLVVILLPSVLDFHKNKAHMNRYAHASHAYIPQSFQLFQLFQLFPRLGRQISVQVWVSNILTS